MWVLMLWPIQTTKVAYLVQFFCAGSYCLRCKVNALSSSKTQLCWRLLGWSLWCDRVSLGMHRSGHLYGPPTVAQQLLQAYKSAAVVQQVL
jgi:hypothetical protein